MMQMICRYRCESGRVWRAARSTTATWHQPASTRQEVSSLWPGAAGCAAPQIVQVHASMRGATSKSVSPVVART